MARKPELTFEDQLVNYVWDHHLVTLDKLATRLGLPKSGAKQDAANIVQRLIDDGPAEISVADLEARGIHIKTVRVPEQKDGNRPFEPMTFAAFDPFVLEAETWETSELRKTLQRLLIVVTRGRDGQPMRAFKIDFAFFWSPTPDQWERIRADWEKVHHLVATGRADDLPKSTETSAVHVKPKGKAGTDRVTAPRGAHMPRSSFALNEDFVEELISEA